MDGVSTCFGPGSSVRRTSPVSGLVGRCCSVLLLLLLCETFLVHGGNAAQISSRANRIGYVLAAGFFSYLVRLYYIPCKNRRGYLSALEQFPPVSERAYTKKG
eukprot:6144511-Pyramimonas_sp.AAC.2